MAKVGLRPVHTILPPVMPDGRHLGRSPRHAAASCATLLAEARAEIAWIQLTVDLVDSDRFRVRTFGSTEELERKVAATQPPRHPTASA